MLFRSLTVVGDDQQTRDFTHVEDICKGLILISETECSADNFDLGRGMPISILDVAKYWTGTSTERINFVSLRKNEGQHTLCDVEETFNKLKWRANNNLIDWINSQR